jgi:sulfatase modifying factor 1
MSRVFISYRRDDSADVTGRIFDKLRASLDEKLVLFRDVDAIPLGRDFREVIGEAFVGCEVVLVIIGPTWVDARNEQGGRRLDDQADFVRIEIEMALKRKLPIIPLLVRRAGMPREVQLPTSLQPLVFHHGLEIRRDPDFHPDMDRLIRALQNMLKKPSAELSIPVSPNAASNSKAGEVIEKPSTSFAFTVPSVPSHAIVPPKAAAVRKFEIASGIYLEFCWIPEGEEQLGSSKDEQEYITKAYFDGTVPDFLEDEKESKRGVFRTNGFWLAKYPTTQEQWKALMNSNPSHFDGKKDNEAKGLNTRRFPVEEVCWNDCQEFVMVLNKLPGVGGVFGSRGKFSLPHEDQWEYACRGGKGNGSPFYWGDKLNGLEANCDGSYPYGTSDIGPYRERTTEVGSYKDKAPHPWGLCDMAGNVAQWCENSYDDVGSNRVVRGGCWSNFAGRCRSANRGKRSPMEGYYDVGFRVVLVLDGQ